MTLTVELLPVLQDNYTYLLHDDATGVTAAVDPSLAEPVLQRLEERGWQLSHVFTTHHHWDHTGGNIELKRATQCEVVGFAGDAHRVPAIDTQLQDNASFDFARIPVSVMHIPGHTLGHIAYYIGPEAMLFCGDTLFSLGCGRLFEGTPGQMHASLMKLAALPDETQIYCGHEYTQANGRFAVTLEPENLALQERLSDVKRLRAEGLPTLPSTIGLEKVTNPFLRSHSCEIRKHLGMENTSDVEVFAEVRRRKDHFAG